MLCYVELCDVRNISWFLLLCSGYKPQFWDLLRLSLDSLIFQILFLLSSYGSFCSHIYLHDVFMVQMTTLKFVIICKGWCFNYMLWLLNCKRSNDGIFFISEAPSYSSSIFSFLMLLGLCLRWSCWSSF